MKAYRLMAGELIWMDCGTLPQALLMRSRKQRKLPRVLVQDLCVANNIIQEMNDLLPVILFRNPDDIIKTKCIRTFTDATFNVSSHSEYGNTGVICEIELKTYKSHQA